MLTADAARRWHLGRISEVLGTADAGAARGGIREGRDKGAVIWDGYSCEATCEDAHPFKYADDEAGGESGIPCWRMEAQLGGDGEEEYASTPPDEPFLRWRSCSDAEAAYKTPDSELASFDAMLTSLPRSDHIDTHEGDATESPIHRAYFLEEHVHDDVAERTFEPARVQRQWARKF